MPIVSIIEDDGTVSTYNVEKDQVIFDAIQDQDRELPHGCLSGSCSACKCEIMAGAENLSAPGSIEQNTLDSVYKSKEISKDRTIRLTCRARVTGDVTLTQFKS